MTKKTLSFLAKYNTLCNNSWWIGWFGLAIILVVVSIHWIDFGSLINIGSISADTGLTIEGKSRLINIYVRALLTAGFAGVGVFLLGWLWADALHDFGRRHHRKIKLITILSALLYIAIFTTLSIQKYRAYNTYVDEAVWFEIFHNFYRGHLIPYSTLQATLGYESISPNVLGYHFVPILYVLFLPFFKFIPYPQLVLFLQTFYLVSSVIPLYLLARIRWESFLAPFILVSVFLLYPTIEYINLYEVEVLRFSIPLVIWGFYFLYTQKWGLYFLTLVLTLMVREEVSLVMIFLGIYIFFMLKERKIGFTTAILSLFYFAIVTYALMPHIYGCNKMAVADQGFKWYGSLPGEIAMNILLHPLQVFERVLHPIKILNLIIYLLPLLFIPSLAPLTTLVAFPNIFITFFSDYLSHSSYLLYYMAPTVALFFIATIEGIRWLQNRHKFLSNQGKIRTPVLLSMLAVSLTLNFFLGPSPLSRQFWDSEYKVYNFRTENFHYSEYIVTPHDRVANKLINAIPNNSVVSAEPFFLPHLYMKRGLRVFPVLAVNRQEPDFVLMDKTNPKKCGIGAIPGSWDGMRQNPQFYYDWVEKRPDIFGLVASEDGIFLYKRKPDAPSYPQPFGAPPEIIIVDSGPEFTGKALDEWAYRHRR